jgi:hypothetical protein
MAVVLLVLAATATGNPFVEQFDSGSGDWQAWRVNDSGGMTLNTPTYQMTGGNDGGFISAALTADANRLYGLQPADTNDFQNLAGYLTVDSRIAGAVTGPTDARVRFYVGTYTGGNNYFVSADDFAWDPNGDLDWTTHAVALLAANFLAWPNQAVGNRTFEQVIAAPEDIGLVFSGGFTNNATLGVSGSGWFMIDNFGVITPPLGTADLPEPATLAFLGVGLAMVLAGRPRRR